MNGAVDPLFEGSDLERGLAQVDVTFSNSLIEAWWRSLKHQWCYLHQLDNIPTVRRLMTFYVQQHNEVMTHSAFNGLTPERNGSRPVKRRLARPARERHPWSRR